MRKSLSKSFLLPILLFLSGLSIAQNEGELMFVGFNADVNDGLSVVALVEIPANTTIFFTDNEWDGSTLATNEGTLQWDTGGSAISPGTVVNLLNLNNGSRNASIGTISSVSGSFNMAVSSEVVLAYRGTATTPSTFLTAIGNNGLGNLSGTGLIDGVNAVNIGNSFDVAAYTGPTACNGSIEECSAQFADASNWSGEGGSGDQSIDGGIDFPSSVPAGIGGTALPVELISFAGKFQQGVILLSWETASEINNDYFELRRSFNGRDFEVVAEINGNGTKSTLTKYEYSDHTVLPVNSIYYQLKQVDYDGQSETFPMVFVSGLNLSSKETLFPNPAKDKITVISEEIPLQIAILDHSGRLVKTVNFNNFSQSVNISELQSGQYLLMLKTKSGGRTHLFIKE